MKPSATVAWVWYRGEHYRGFQRQVDGPTIQEALAKALACLGVEDQPAPAGRTDRGVHARMQVVRFSVPENVAVTAQGLSPHLPEDVGVVAVVPSPRKFHPQWRCAGKEYRYRFALGPVPEPWKGYAWDVSTEPRLQGAQIDPARVAELLRACIGTRDFGSFHEKSSPRGPRTLWETDWVDRGEGLHEVRLRGDRFGRYQVRYLVGSAVAAAAGVISTEAFLGALNQALPLEGLKAKAAGLTLWNVHYPPEIDPFSESLRAEAPGLPGQPPF